MSADSQAMRPGDTDLLGTRSTAIAGIVFAVLFVAGMFAMITPDSSSEQDVTAFYADSGNRITVLIAVYLIALAGAAFLWFLGGLRRVLQTTAGGRSLSDVVLAGGVVFVVLMYAGAAAIGTGSAGMELGGEEAFSTDVLRMLPQLGYGFLLVFGMFGAIVMIVATSVAALQTGVLPSWLGWLGVVVAVLLLASVVYLPMVFLPIWVVATSVVLLREPRPVPSADYAAAGNV